MNRKPFQRKIIYFVLMVALILPLSMLSQPSTAPTRPGEQGSPGGKLAMLRNANQLSQANLGEIDPTGETIKLATLGLRGVATNILWSRAHEQIKREDWSGVTATLEQLTKLQPNFVSVWKYQGWNLSYNISVEFDDYRDRYAWVIRGLEFLQEGTRYNEKDVSLITTLGWTTAQKIGRADERVQFRELFSEDEDFIATTKFPLPRSQWDNWLVGREYYNRAEAMVENEGLPIKGQGEALFFSGAPMCLMNYAENLEVDGVFGEKARGAWQAASRAWRAFGDRQIPTYEGRVLRMNDVDNYLARARALQEQLDKELAPGVREELLKQKEATLTQFERDAMAMPIEKMKQADVEASYRGQTKLLITAQEISDKVTGPNSEKAQQLAKQIEEELALASQADKEKAILNFNYWLKRAEMEQLPEAVEARRLIHEARRAYEDETDLTTAQSAYAEGFVKWRGLLDKYPEVINETSVSADLLDHIMRYEEVLKQLGEDFPEDFPLPEIRALPRDG